jgi:hypothetical protein
VKHNFEAINATRQRLQRNDDAQRINDVASTANQLQAQQPGLSRTEALRVAEIMVARERAARPA